MAPLNEESVQEIAAEGQQVELTPEQKKEMLGKLMADGKRDLKAGDFEASGQKFGEAAEFAAEHYGPLAAESFEPNFMYGRSLVELSVIENDLFKNALTNITKKNDEETEEKEEDGNESMTEEEKEDVRELVAEALTENAEALENEETDDDSKEEANDERAKGDKADEEPKEEKTEVDSKDEKTEVESKEEKTEVESKEEKAEEKKESDAGVSAGDDKKEEEKTEEAAGDEKDEAMDDGGAAEKEDIEEEDDEEEEDEDLDNNQLAWESLEVASKIADKMIEETASEEWKKKKADVYVQLAQCAANDEKYDMALEDLGRARVVLAEITTLKGDRLTSEIYFHEGRINRLRNEFGLAEESFKKAAGAMETLFEEVKAEAGSEPTDLQKEEMADMLAIIKDFKDRAEDCKGSAVQKEMVAKMAEEDKASKPTILTSSNANSDPTATDITSLVRKRAHDAEGTEGTTKKAKSEGAEEVGEENIAV